MSNSVKVSPGKDEVKKEVKSVKMAPLFELFRHSKRQDKFLLAFGLFFASVSGLMMPALNIVFGDMINAAAAPIPDGVADAMRSAITTLLYIAAVVSFSFFASFACTMTAASRNVARIRDEYVNAVFDMSMDAFDKIDGSRVTNTLDEVANDVYFGTSAKLVELVQGTSMIVAGFAVAFYYSWEMTLVLLAGIPPLGIAASLMFKLAGSQDAYMGKEAYQKAGSIASEVLGAMRTIVSIRGEKQSAKRYEDNLEVAEKAAIRQGWLKGIFTGVLWGIMFSLYGLGFWFGAQLIIWSTNDAIEKYPPPAGLMNATVNGTGPYADYAPVMDLYCNGLYEGAAREVCACSIPWSSMGLEDIYCGCNKGGDQDFQAATCFRGGDCVLVFFSVLIAGFAMGQVSPALEKLGSSRVAAAKMYDTIDKYAERRRVAKQAARVKLGHQDCKVDVHGTIKFDNIHFKYASREHKLFSGLSFEVPGGSTVAFVGESGCGKSTLGKLFLRLYDPNQGDIKIDGTSIRDMDVKSLRRQIGVVSQEPLLFEGTISDNIRYGKGEDEKVTQEEIVAAAKAASCHDFISKFPQGYDTVVGSRGGKISGGQKQRIAIARALLRNPPILILDEATSALDSKSESDVQNAIDNMVAKGSKRTVFVIAHRLSTIRNADMIVVLGSAKGTSTVRDGASVLEIGTHDELISKSNGFYRALAMVTDSNKAKSIDNETKEDDDNSTIDVDIKQKTFKSGETKQNGLQPFEMEADESKNESKKTESCCSKLFGGGEKKKDENEPYKVESSRVWSYSKPDYPILVVGLVASTLNGVIWPAIAVAFAEILVVLYDFDTNEIQNGARKWGLVFLGIGTSSFILNLLQGFSFSIVGERLTTRLRADVFRALMRQNIGWFDDPKNGVGSLTSTLSTDTSLIHYTTGTAFGGQLYTVTNILAGLSMSLYASWQFSLGLLVVMPIFTVAAILEMVLFTGSESKIRGVLDPVMSFVNEAVSGIREVKAFAMENRVTKNVRDKMKESMEKEMTKQALIQGCTQGLVQAVQMSFYAFAFWLGARLIENGDITFKKMNVALWALAFAASGLGTAASFFGDQGKANAAKSRIFELIDRVPKIESKPFDKMVVPNEFASSTCKGDIEFQNVKFAYPTRLGATVFESLSLKIPSGSTVAFVGSSGSGKSTVVALLERFYDPLSGTINLDGKIKIDEIDLKWLRSQISMVGQEPRLFNTTVFENIAYSNPDDVMIDDVKRAAKAAHCDFIDSLEHGYDTVVGENGSKLSGGQKQRIAIARAILNQPKILLLDEATSALDNESEKIVQESLYEIMKSSTCTTVVIAHKLSTIVNADCIFVIDNEGSGSRVVEYGTHKELLEKGGKYKALYQAYTSNK